MKHIISIIEYNLATFTLIKNHTKIVSCLDIEKELGVEIVGDTKIKVPIEDVDDDYDEIIDEEEVTSIDDVNENYLK